METTITTIKSKLKSSSVACLENSNDLKLLFYHYGINNSTIERDYHNYAKLNFIPVHYQFTNLTQAFSTHNP